MKRTPTDLRQPPSSVLYMSASIFNIVLGALDIYLWEDTPYFGTRRRYYGASSLLGFICGPIRRVWSYITSQIRYGLRYSSKFQPRKDDSSIKLRPTPAWFSNTNQSATLSFALSHEGQRQSSSPPQTYDTVLLIASHLHYSDLVSLSLVSRRWYQAIFPDTNLEQRAEALRMKSCQDGSKTQCWICNVQICEVRLYHQTI